MNERFGRTASRTSRLPDEWCCQFTNDSLVMSLDADLPKRLAVAVRRLKERRRFRRDRAFIRLISW